MKYQIRKIEEKDNLVIANIIRECLVEYGGNREGLAWADPKLDSLSEVYIAPNECYWIAEDENGKVVGGCGIGNRTEKEGVCELQKMYCRKEVRGTGVASILMDTALNFAKSYYEICYIETLSNMERANHFYQKYGFTKLAKPLIETEHYACDVWYMKSL